MRRLLPVIALALLAGCGTPAKLNYYTLAVAQASGAGAASGAASVSASASPSASASAPATPGRAFSVYVGPVTIPEAVDRPQMVMRIAANQVEIADLDRWAEPLKAAIPRLISETLTRELATPTVMTSRQSATLAFDYRVAVDVQRFDFTGDAALVDALWTLRTEKDGAPRTGRSEAREPAASRDPRSMAAAQSRAIEKVARDIAEAIRALERR
jgi:hypothetical protein